MRVQRAPLPARGVEIAAGIEMRDADSDEIVEGQGIVRRQVEGDHEPLDGGIGIALVDVDPSAAAPGPGRAAVHGERLADDQVRRLDVAERREGIAEEGERGCVSRKRQRLPRELRAPGTLLEGRRAEVIDDPLRVGPGGERHR